MFIGLERLPTIQYAPVVDENPISLENRIRKRHSTFQYTWCLEKRRRSKHVEQFLDIFFCSPCIRFKDWLHFLTPLSQCPVGTFSLSVDENFYRNSNRNKKSFVSSSKSVSLKCNSFHSISNGDKLWDNYPMGLKF